MKITQFFLIYFVLQDFGFARNPITPDRGANDPHIRIFNGKAYLSASHDKSIGMDNSILLTLSFLQRP
jgi:hypothetical protein